MKQDKIRGVLDHYIKQIEAQELKVSVNDAYYLYMQVVRDRLTTGFYNQKIQLLAHDLKLLGFFELVREFPINMRPVPKF